MKSDDKLQVPISNLHEFPFPSEDSCEHFGTELSSRPKKQDGDSFDGQGSA